MQLKRMHALKLFYQDELDYSDIAKALKVTEDTARNYVADGMREAARRIDSRFVDAVRLEIASEHRACIEALREERDQGGPIGEHGPTGVAGTCRAMKGHLDSLSTLYDAPARTSIESMIMDHDWSDVAGLRKLLLTGFVAGRITPAGLTAASRMVDSLDTEKGDKYQGQGDKILRSLAVGLLGGGEDADESAADESPA